MRIERGGSLIDSLLQQLMRFGRIGGQVTGQGRRFPQLLLVTAILHHMHKGGNRPLRRPVSRQSRFAKQAASLLRGELPAPVGQYGDIFTARMLLQGVNQGQRALAAGCHGAGGVDHQQGVIVRTVEQDSKRGDIALAAGIVAQIQRVIRHNRARQRLTQTGERLFTERRQLAVA